MMWHWYLARENELLLDLDSKFRLNLAMKKLERADRESAITIKQVYAAPSFSDGKYHMVLQIQNSFSTRQRILWAWWAGSDPIRAMYNLTRVERSLAFPDLLIAPREWRKFWRGPDYYCECSQKHVGWQACVACPIFQTIHGADAGMAYYPLEEKTEFVPGLQPWPPKPSVR